MDIVKAALDFRRQNGNRPWPPARLALALQGGGSFGAFTWGALERLLEEENLALDAFSGASAGAVNAALLASGLAEGGREGARKNLEKFWTHASQSAAFLPKAVTLPLGFLARAMSPYQFNPFDLNPLRVALEAHVDFERLRHLSSPRLLIAATRVSTASLRIFRNDELTVEFDPGLGLPALAAPIDRDRRRPVLGRRLYRQSAADAAGGGERRLGRPDHPDHAEPLAEPRRARASDIERRIEQINFASTLDREIEAIRLLAPLCAAGDASGKWAKLRIDRLSAEDNVQSLAEHSPGNLEWSFISQLRDAGRAAANDWLAQSAISRPIS